MEYVTESRLEFQDLSFMEMEDSIRATLMRLYAFEIPKQALQRIADFEISEKAIVFKGIDENSARQKFNMLVGIYIKELRHKLTKKPVVYMHSASGIPLIGNASFGIVYRNTNVIELKPSTGCNLNCVYCSVDEGPSTRKKHDFVVELDYLVEETKKLAEFVKEDLTVHIGVQGEPLLYPKLVELVREVGKIPNVKEVSTNTNATLLTEKIVDDLVNAGMTLMTVSLDAMDNEIAQKMAGARFNVEHIKKIAAYIAQTKCKLILAPVYMKGYNDDELEKLVVFAKEINKNDRVKIGIQNFLNYASGRNPVKQLPWEEFYGKLKMLEEKHGIPLILSSDDFNIHSSRILPKPIRKKQVVDVPILAYGQGENERIGALKNRSINIMNCSAPIGKTVRVKIVRSKHNIFAGITL